MLDIISSIIYTSTNDDNFNTTDYFLNPKEPAQSNDIFQKSYPIPWLGNKRLRFDLIS